jgi:hypothetical protein
MIRGLHGVGLGEGGGGGKGGERKHTVFISGGLRRCNMISVLKESRNCYWEGCEVEELIPRLSLL